MDVTEFIGKVHIAYKGKGAQKAPAFSTVKANQYLSVANDKLRQWGADPMYLWDSLFSLETVTYSGGPVEVPDRFQKLADSVEFDTSDSHLELRVVRPIQRKSFRNAVYVAGNDPQSIYFTSAVPDVYLGATMTIPCNLKPAKLTRASQKILIDNIDWLILATAAELARNDPAKDDQFGTLNGLANIEYRKMQTSAIIIVHNQPNAVQSGSATFNMGGPAV